MDSFALTPIDEMSSNKLVDEKNLLVRDNGFMLRDMIALRLREFGK